MGTSTDATICYGVLLEDDIELPWHDEKWDDDEEDWWLAETGWEPVHHVWDDAGQYMPGFDDDDPRIDEYFAHKKQWLEAHPLPFELVNVCSNEEPIWILAVPGSVRTASRGHPMELDINRFILTPDIKALAKFAGKYNIEHEKGPAWFLSSYWG